MNDMTDDAITFEMIAPILRLSAYNTMIKNLASVKLTWTRLENIFPQISFVENEFSYVNPYNQKMVLISGLLGKSFFKQSEHKTDKFFVVLRDVNYILNKKAQVEKMSSNERANAYVDALNKAIEKRKKHRRGKYREHLAASDKICGWYDLGKHSLKISNDPMDIFMKSTGQAWERESCERVGGMFEDGIFSDIEWCNCVVFLYNNTDNVHPIARVMVRLCTTNQLDRVSFGIEPIWYAKHGKVMGDDSIENLTVNRLRENIIDIIESKGFDMDYKECMTPFKYRGYSDNEHEGQTMITYRDAKRKF